MQVDKIVCIMLDSWRKDHVGWFDRSRADIDTSAVDAFADDPDTVVFTDAYPEALPTVPIRTSLFTGQRTLPFRAWQPLTDEDRLLQQLLRQHGYVTSLITDTYHLAKPGMNFHQGFDSFEWIRGQEGDNYRVAPHGEDLDDYVGHPSVREQTDQYLRNIRDRNDEREAEYFAARVMQRGMEWLEDNRDTEQFFLWLDSFDPHEPWDPPSAYAERYTDPDYDGPHLILPRVGPSEEMSEAEIEHVRGLYAAMVDFTTDWVGRLLEKLKELGLYESTLVILLSDHGEPLGEHGIMRKAGGNLYSELLEIPIFVKPPVELTADREFVNTADGLVRTDDLPATLLDLVGLEHESNAMHGRSLVPLMEGRRDAVRDTVVTGYHNGTGRCVRDGRWSFVLRPDEDRDELYDLENDPEERANVIEEEPAKADELAAQIGSVLRTDHSTPPLDERSPPRT
jgi:arylsulfatase A-like enzyme